MSCTKVLHKSVISHIWKSNIFFFYTQEFLSSDFFLQNKVLKTFLKLKTKNISTLAINVFISVFWNKTLSEMSEGWKHIQMDLGPLLRYIYILRYVHVDLPLQFRKHFF